MKVTRLSETEQRFLRGVVDGAPASEVAHLARAVAGNRRPLTEGLLDPVDITVTELPPVSPETLEGYAREHAGHLRSLANRRQVVRGLAGLVVAGGVAALSGGSVGGAVLPGALALIKALLGTGESGAGGPETGAGDPGPEAGQRVPEGKAQGRRGAGKTRA